MANSSFDLDGYLERIGYRGPQTAALETLRALHFHHVLAIPFENLNPLLRWPVPLDVASLQKKLVDERRGGYCYEHNLLFAEALRAMGFSVTGLAARVLWMAPEGHVTPRSHMLLRVDIGGTPFIADVGFGGVTLTEPLRLELDSPQSTSHERFRLAAHGAAIRMEAEIGGAWKPLYAFTTEEHLQVDYEVANWFVSTHPSSPFVNTLRAARTVPDRRLALLNTQLSVYDLAGGVERRMLTSGREIRDVLEREIGIVLPTAPDLDEALDRLVLTVSAAAGS